MDRINNCQSFTNWRFLLHLRMF